MNAGKQPEPVMIPLVQLIRRRLDELGNPPLRPLTKAAGVPELYGTLQRYADPSHPRLRSGMRKQTIQKLARVLQLPVSEVEAAEAQSMDRVRQNEEPARAPMTETFVMPDGLRVIVSVWERLSDLERRQMERMVRAMFEEQQAQGGQQAHGEG